MFQEACKNRNVLLRSYQTDLDAKYHGRFHRHFRFKLNITLRIQRHVHLCSKPYFFQYEASRILRQIYWWKKVTLTHTNIYVKNNIPLEFASPYLNSKSWCQLFFVSLVSYSQHQGLVRSDGDFSFWYGNPTTHFVWYLPVSSQFDVNPSNNSCFYKSFVTINNRAYFNIKMS